MPATHPHPQLQDVHGRDPRLRQPADQQQLSQWRASAQSVFPRFFLPFHPLVSAGSAKCTSAAIGSAEIRARS
jgi:hypothetical protein